MDSNLSSYILNIILVVPGFLIAITVHEFTHGYVAYRLGDPTAKLMGRLTLNPISHLDPFGTLALVLTQMIGWAKPVPVDARYLRNPRTDMLWISLGGREQILLPQFCSPFLLHLLFFLFGQPRGFILEPLTLMVYLALRINVVLAIFNLIPVLLWTVRRFWRACCRASRRTSSSS